MDLIRTTTNSPRTLHEPSSPLVSLYMLLGAGVIIFIIGIFIIYNATMNKFSTVNIMTLISGLILVIVSSIMIDREKKR